MYCPFCLYMQFLFIKKIKKNKDFCFRYPVPVITPVISFCYTKKPTVQVAGLYVAFCLGVERDLKANGTSSRFLGDFLRCSLLGPMLFSWTLQAQFSLSLCTCCSLCLATTTLHLVVSSSSFRFQIKSKASIIAIPYIISYLALPSLSPFQAHWSPCCSSTLHVCSCLRAFQLLFLLPGTVFHPLPSLPVPSLSSGKAIECRG